MNLPDQLHFIRPLWLLALPLAVLLPWAFAHVRRPSGDWERVCDPHLLRWLSVRQGGTGSRSGAWLAGAGLAIAVLALSGPSWQKLPESTLSAPLPPSTLSPALPVRLPTVYSTSEAFSMTSGKT